MPDAIEAAMVMLAVTPVLCLYTVDSDLRSNPIEASLRPPSGPCAVGVVAGDPCGTREREAATLLLKLRV
jgi:hypothetical protein